MTFDEGIEYEPVFEVDLSIGDVDEAAEKLRLLHRAAILKGEHEDYLRHRQALDPESLAKAIFTYESLSRIRRQLRHREGVLLDIEDVANAIKDLFSTEARERIGAIRIQRKRKLKKGPSQVTSGEAGTQPSPGPPVAGPPHEPTQ